MANKTNGETSKLRREENKLGNKLDSQGKNKVGTDGESVGPESERTNRTVGKARIFTGGECETLGKILEQLQELQREHIKYIEAHGDRLVQGLQENNEYKSKVLGKMGALEEEVVRILSGEAELLVSDKTEEE
nr:hypothetical protein [Okeania sp. SIO3B5]